MAKTKSMKFGEFMNGSYKEKKSSRKGKTIAKIGATVALPLALGSPLGIVLGVSRALASTNDAVPVVVAVPASAKEWMGEQTLSALAHVLDPVVDILVALSFPVASVVIVGACFFFIFGNAEKAWGMIQNAGLGYVLIQVSPLILNVLKQVGNAV